VKPARDLLASEEHTRVLYRIAGAWPPQRISIEKNLGTAKLQRHGASRFDPSTVDTQYYMCELHKMGQRDNSEWIDTSRREEKGETRRWGEDQKQMEDGGGRYKAAEAVAQPNRAG